MPEMSNPCGFQGDAILAADMSEAGIRDALSRGFTEPRPFDLHLP